MMNWKTLAGGFAASTIAIVAAQDATAQITTSNLNGQVVDANRAAVSGAAVTIVHVPTGTTSSAVTSANGTFFDSGLRVGGPYIVTVESAAGDTQRENIFLQPSVNTLNFTVADAERTLEAVVVRGDVGSRLDLNNGVGSVFSNDDILDQPSVQRDLIATLVRDPLASSSGEGQLSVAGANPRFNALAIDGALLQDDFGLSDSTYPTSRSPINLDSIESASVLASDYSVKASGFTGGLVNVVTKSGSNEFEGSAFYYRRDEDFVGNTAFEEFNEVPAFTEEEYGVTLGGPIIKDKLFFFVSYDEFETASGRNFSSNDENDGIDPRLFSELNQIVLDQYGIDMGGRPTVISIPATSERFQAKIDWNINEDHRATFSYFQTEEAELSSVSSSEFVSAWYDVPQEVKVYTAQLNSDWSDRLSTEFRVNYKDNFRGQVCGNPNSGEIDIRLSEEDLVGTPLEGLIDDGDDVVDDNDEFLTGSCDRFRHANEFEDERLQLFGAANYILGDHFITVGAEYENYELFNLFVPRSNGEFIFDTYDELISGSAEVRYDNATSNNAADGAAAWSYDVISLFAQDSWQIRPDFRLDYGLRYQYYSQDDAPVDAPAFEQRYGFKSNQNLDGKDLILPRVSFEYTPFARTKLTGGFGLFAGAEPKVWISNAFQVPVARASGTFDSVDPLTVPQALLDDVAGTDTSTLLPIDTISPDFEIPSEWKYSIKLDQGFDLDLNPYGVPLNLGDNYQFSLQYLHTETEDGFRWTNIAQTEFGDALPTGVAPDGRPIYADLEALGVSNATILGNYSGGSSDIFSASLSNDFDNGFGFFVSYANQNVETVTPGTSSRGISNWRAIVDSDRNNPGVGTSNFEIEHAFKVSLSYETAIFGDLLSEFNVFGNIQSGSPFSYSFNVNDDNALFGRAGDGEDPFDNDLLYIPNVSGGAFSDPTVVFADSFDQDGFLGYIQGRGLPTGSIVDRNDDNGPWNQQWDFQYSQELPLANFGMDRFNGNKLKFVVDVENVGNLLNDEWGTRVNAPRFPVGIVDADLVSAADVAENGIDGATALTEDAPRTTCLQASDCLYRFNDFDDDPSGFNAPSASVYSIRVGIRYEF